ncbi:MAG: hypothetical protein QOD53_1136, partial [Thermoleophilaceae bacterium]|nr:hypothetical protein [Thermoleophilaceae bacterium]
MQRDDLVGISTGWARAEPQPTAHVNGRAGWIPHTQVIAALVLLAAAIWATSAGAPPAFAAGSPNWGTGIKATLPADAGTIQSTVLSSVSCASAGDCAAVGSYYDSSNNRQALLLTESAGTWAMGVKATPPAGAGTNPTVSLNSVSCASAGNCAAVGTYFDSSNTKQGLLLTESAGTWAMGVKAILPAGAGTSPNPSLYSVSCAAAGDCAAVGNYTDSSNHQQALLLTESAGTWAMGVKATLPAVAATSPSANLYSVSCASAGNCAAVGYYYDSSGHQQALLLTESAGTWAMGVNATLPADAATNPGAGLISVSCASAGNCAAVGTYFDSSNTQQGLLLTESAGTWAMGA